MFIRAIDLELPSSGDARVDQATRLMASGVVLSVGGFSWVWLGLVGVGWVGWVGWVGGLVLVLTVTGFV